MDFNILAPRFGISFVWIAVPIGWLANFLISYCALKKAFPGEPGLSAR